MRSFRYIYVASLRLDSPLAGLSGAVPDTVNQCLATAGFTALSRLVSLCEREHPDALLLAGNTFCAAERHLTARLRLLEAFTTLQRMGVRVCVAPGRDDPPSAWASLRHLPPHVTVFGDEPGCVELLHEGRVVAMVCGQAWSADSAGATPLLWVQSHEDAQRSADLATNPWSAPVQGLGFHEEGEHGCTVVTARFEQGAWTFAERFEPLGPVVWRTEELDANVFGADMLSANALHANVFGADVLGAGNSTPVVHEGERPANELSGLATRLAQGLDAQLDRVWPGCELLVLRLALRAKHLRTDDAVWWERLREKLNEELYSEPSGAKKSEGHLPVLWVAELGLHEVAAQELAQPHLPDHPHEDASNAVSVEAAPSGAQTRQDLVGELQRLNISLRGSEEALNAAVERALAPLLASQHDGLNLRPDGQNIVQADGAFVEAGQIQKELLDRAERLCLNKLQNSLEGGELSRRSGNGYSGY